MKNNYLKPLTIVTAMLLKKQLLNMSYGSGQNGVSASRASYGTSSEEIWN